MLVETSGTQTAVVGTEHTLASPTTAKTRALLVDVAAMVAGDTVELRFFGPVLADGTSRLILMSTSRGVVGDPHTQSPPILMPQGGTVTLKQTAGTARAYPWTIITLD
jgi:hypothetical protein